MFADIFAQILGRPRKSRKLRPNHRGLTFEFLEERELLAYDFGDAPASYGTRLAQDGARHGDFGVTLGTLRDTEPDGEATLSADGDGGEPGRFG